MYRDFSNRLSQDFLSINRDEYIVLTDKIVNNFKLISHTKLVNGIDEIFQEFKTDNKIVSLEWDNWSGYSVVAINSLAEDLLEDICKFIEDYISKKLM